MKLRNLALAAVLLFCAGTVYSQTSDEQALDQAIQSVWSNRPGHQNQTTQTTGDDQNVTITTTTVTTTTVTVMTNYVADDNTSAQNTSPVQTTPAASNQPEVVQVQISSGRQIGMGTLVLAESLGICVPGFGLAHFTLGDTTGGRIALIVTGVSLLGYFGAEVAVETRTIDNPDIYGALHYGSMALFFAGYLFDVIHAPIYYSKYNKQFNQETAFVRPLDIEFRDYQWNPDETAVQFVNVGLRF